MEERWLKGYMASKGISISEHKLQQTLPQASPGAHNQRQSNGLERSNPHVYVARYPKTVGSSVMLRKNNLTIYEEIYQQVTLQYGLFDVVRVDQGREFYLTLCS